MKNYELEQDKEKLFQQLYVEHYDEVYAYFFARIRKKELAEDLIQEFYIKAWNQIEMIQQIKTSQRRYWLFKVAQNLTVDYYRKQATQHKMYESVKNQVFIDNSRVEDISSQFENHENLKQLEELIYNLEEDVRTLLLMNVMGGMNSTQISESLNIPAGTVRYKIHVARQKLMEVFHGSRMEGGEEKR